MTIRIIFIPFTSWEQSFELCNISMDYLFTTIYMNYYFQNNYQQLSLINWINVQAHNKFIQTLFIQCKWSLELHIRNVCTKIQFHLYSYNVYIRIQIRDYIYTRIMSTYTFIKIKCHIKILRRLLYHFLPLTMRKFSSDMVLLTVSS